MEALARGKRTDKGTTHSYLGVYEELMAPRRQSAREVLELGVQHGGSIRLWLEYFAGATVTGLDLADQGADLGGEARVRFWLRDAYDPACVAALADRRYDVVVDDGPHTLESMKFVASHYSLLLAPGGLLVIEDVPRIEWVPEIVAAFPPEVRARASFVDLRGVKGQFDDILVVLDLAK